MKKTIKVLILIITLLLTINVYAANYQMNELIPINIETSIHTKNFSYKQFSYTDNSIVFKGIKNLTEEEKPISISIALFDKNRRNIGTINYCGANLAGKSEINYTIDVTDKYLGEKSKLKDIKYIAVIGDNINCRISGYDEFIGQRIEEMKVGKNNTLDSQSELLIKIMSIIAIALVLLFLYKFLFTRSFQNFDGSDVRQGYKRVNEDLKKEREEKEKNYVEPIKDNKNKKSEEIIKQEEQAKNEDKANTELHNLYK